MDTNHFSLNLEQQFHMRLVQSSVQQMNQNQMRELLIELVETLMIKDNAIRDLMKDKIFGA